MAVYRSIHRLAQCIDAADFVRERCFQSRTPWVKELGSMESARVKSSGYWDPSTDALVPVTHWAARRSMQTCNVGRCQRLFKYDELIRLGGRAKTCKTHSSTRNLKVNQRKRLIEGQHLNQGSTSPNMNAGQKSCGTPVAWKETEKRYHAVYGLLPLRKN